MARHGFLRQCKQEQRSNRAARACQGVHAEGVPRHSRPCREMAVWSDEETTKLIELRGEEDIQVRGRGMKLKAIEAATASTSTTLLRT